MSKVQLRGEFELKPRLTDAQQLTYLAIIEYGGMNGGPAALSCKEKAPYFEALTHIELDSTNISDVSPIATLRNLRQISVGTNPIPRIPGLMPLASLPKLEIIQANGIGGKLPFKCPRPDITCLF